MRICALATIVLSLAATGCQAAKHASVDPAGTGPNPMLDKTAVGKNRCEDGGPNFSPFVVEWDATDLSTFEAKASRDLVFVKYDACSIQMLYSCSDNAVPGRYGRYQEPTFTSGTVESLKVRNEDELYAKLPLGAIAFGGNVKVGEELEMLYYVSGVVSSTRNSVERGAIKPNPGCEGATHFVSAYNLGAFKLLAHKGQSGEVNVGFKGAGGGAKTSSDSESLKQGGKLDSCESQAQRQCRVPIRLVLNKVQAAVDNPDADMQAAAGAAAVPDPPPAYEDSPAGRAWKLRESARSKESAGDGPGCLQDLDRALKLEDNAQSRRASSFTRAGCLALAGKCKEGKKLYRETMANLDTKRRVSDKQLDKRTEAFGKLKCPVSQQANFEDRAMRLGAELGAAQKRGDAQGCIAVAKQAEKLHKKIAPALKKLVKTKKIDIELNKKRGLVGGLVTRAAACLDELDSCKEARRLYFRSYDMLFSGTMPEAEIKKAAEATFARFPNCGSG